MKRALYIHIPFCNYICHYCDFNKRLKNINIENDYIDCLIKELDIYNIKDVKTIYIGGGTPLALEFYNLEKLLKYLEKFSGDIEYTIEANPDNNEIEKIELLKKYGVNRISLGVQDFNESITKNLGRCHSVSDIYTFINNVKSVGINNINVDLIYNLPNQTFNDVEMSLNHIKDLGVNHISYYSLIVEDLSVLGKRNYVSDIDLEGEFMDFINDKIDPKFIRYEVSNYCLDGYESKHNLEYWNNNEYYAVGLGSHGYLNNKRYENTKSLKNYIDLVKGNKYPIESIESIDSDECMFEELMLKFRTNKGINLNEFEKVFGINFFDKYNVDKKYFDINENIVVKEKYWYMLNDIIINMEK